MTKRTQKKPNIIVAWKAEEFGPAAPFVVMQWAEVREEGRFGVWEVIDFRTGAARPVGSGAHMRLDEAISGATDANNRTDRIEFGNDPARA